MRLGSIATYLPADGVEAVFQAVEAWSSDFGLVCPHDLPDDDPGLAHLIVHTAAVRFLDSGPLRSGNVEGSGFFQAQARLHRRRFEPLIRYLDPYLADARAAFPEYEVDLLAHLHIANRWLQRFLDVTGEEGLASLPVISAAVAHVKGHSAAWDALDTDVADTTEPADLVKSVYSAFGADLDFFIRLAVSPGIDDLDRLREGMLKPALLGLAIHEALEQLGEETSTRIPDGLSALADSSSAWTLIRQSADLLAAHGEHRQAAALSLAIVVVARRIPLDQYPSPKQLLLDVLDHHATVLDAAYDGTGSLFPTRPSELDWRAPFHAVRRQVQAARMAGRIEASIAAVASAGRGRARVVF